MGEHKLGSEFDKADKVSTQMLFAKKFIDDNGIKMTLRPPNEKEVAAALASAKKKGQLYAVLDLPLIQVQLRIGSLKPILIGSKDLDSLHDNGKEREILNKLADSTKLITRDEVWKWHDTHYDSEEFSFFAGTIDEMERDQSKLQKRYDALKNFKYDSNDAGSLRQELHEFTKKHSWEHYLQFVDDIDAAGDGKKIFDKYAKDGATFPVNLPPALKAPLEKAISSNAKPDFGAARTLIVKLIDTKFIPEMRKAEMATAAKELARLKTAIPEKKRAFVKAGGKP